VTVALDTDRRRAIELASIPPDVLERLDRFAALLLTWQQKTNLIAPSTIPHLWTRHIADSLQLIDLVPAARIWIDLGSGAGFPGVVIATALARYHDTCVHLVESNGKKAAFLREAVRLAAPSAVVHHERIEDFVARFNGPVDAVTARAVAPLKVLLDQSVKLMSQGAVGVFPKGREWAAERLTAAEHWDFECEAEPSRTESGSAILVIHSLKSRVANQP